MDVAELKEFEDSSVLETLREELDADELVETREAVVEELEVGMFKEELELTKLEVLETEFVDEDTDTEELIEELTLSDELKELETEDGRGVSDDDENTVVPGASVVVF